MAVFAGYFGEPYCSIGCKLMGGTEAMQATMNGASGNCHVCGKSVQASPYVDRCFVVPFDGAFLFVCADCADKGKVFLASVTKCCRCGDALA